MNVIYWDERDLESDREPTAEHRPVERPELRLQHVSEAAAARDAARERFISQWLSERQCSGL